ncbi:MAG TPA: LacI family DNA-binding transcriptional regulator [Opitutaceae bacterium]|nr:LacI family DNA-binding transcriptional regulator [Opitutaceae bacterium]
MPTVRSIARTLGLSAATVSGALNGRGRIARTTQERVLSAARLAGYKPNPLAATLMAALRRSRGATFRGVVAAVDFVEPTRPPHGAFHRELLAGAGTRAAELGFKLTEFFVGRSELTVPRLDAALHARGINGVLLLPAWHAPDWSELDWSRYAGVYTDYNVGAPGLHSVCCDHYRSMMLALARLAARGYRRPGIFLEQGRNVRIHHRWSAAFHAFQESQRSAPPVPPLFTPELRREGFLHWFRRHEPDVVISHSTDTIEWMESAGARVPATHGFVCLNLLYKGRPCAGLDQQPRELGARSVEMLIAQLQRNERGIPEWPTTTTIPARWVDGPTVRAEQVVEPPLRGGAACPQAASSPRRTSVAPR